MKYEKFIENKIKNNPLTTAKDNVSETILTERKSTQNENR